MQSHRRVARNLTGTRIMNTMINMNRTAFNAKDQFLLT